MNYEDFKNTCETLGKKFDIDVKVEYIDLSRWGRPDWYQACFRVDNFGGDAAAIKFYEDNLWYEGIHFSKIFTRWEEMEEWLACDVAEEKACRHFDYDMLPAD